jgi:acyl-CoA dehydrogenase
LPADPPLLRGVLAGLAAAGEDWERRCAVPAEVWHELGRLGLLGLDYPRRLGGAGAPLSHSVAFLTELGRTGYAGFRTAVAVHAYMANRYLGEYADPSLQREYLTPALAGHRVAGLAISEPDAGSDLAGLATRAVRDGSDYLLTGTKTMVVNGSCADYFVLACRTGETRAGAAGLSLLLVDADSPGLTVTPQRTLGWRSAAIAELRLAEVRVPGQRVIGRAGGGFLLLMYALQYERLAAAALALGGTEYCLQILVDRVRSRTVRGQRLADFQVVRHRIAALATELAAARELVARAGRAFGSNRLPVTECSMAKVYATELASRAADACLQLSGAAGYLDDAAAARLLRDSRAATLAAGPTEVLYDLVAEELLG